MKEKRLHKFIFLLFFVKANLQNVYFQMPVGFVGKLTFTARAAVTGF